MTRRRFSGSANPPHGHLDPARIKLEELRRQRAQPTPAEGILWSVLRARQLEVKFRNRHCIAGFFLDFYAPVRSLAMEVDGTVHDTTVEYDAERTDLLAAFGITVVRVRNEEVLQDLETALARIREAILALRLERAMR